MNRTWSRTGVAALALAGLVVADRRAAGSQAQVAGATTLGVTVEEMKAFVIPGWSAKNKKIIKYECLQRQEREDRRDRGCDRRA